MLGFYLLPLAFVAGMGVLLLILGYRYRPAPPLELKVTSPDGTLLHTDTAALEHVWRSGDRSTDGYIDILQMPRLHVWVRPLGYEEPASRLEALDGTAALPDGLARYHR